jgi:hypothetical protein
MGHCMKGSRVHKSARVRGRSHPVIQRFIIMRRA